VLAPDELRLSLNLMRPRFTTPGRPINYIQRYFGGENSLRCLGETAILPLRLDAAKDILPAGPAPASIFLSLAFANVDQRGGVQFLGLPFDYRLDTKNASLGLGAEIKALPEGSDFNAGLWARLDGYYGDISVRGVSPGVWVDRYDRRGPGWGYAVGVSLEAKAEALRLPFLPKNTWLFAALDFTRAEIADFADIDGITASLGIKISLRP